MPSERTSAAAILIDDDEMIRVMFSRILEQAGVSTIHTAADNEQGLQILSETGDNVAYVLIDIDTPRGNAESCVRKASERFPAARIFVLTGYGSTSFDAKAAGATGVLGKPVSVSHLLNSLGIAMLSSGPAP